MEISDPRKWRISKSGFSIKTGWADEKKYIAKYPGQVQPLDTEAFKEWMINAQHICDMHNEQFNKEPPADQDAHRNVYCWVLEKSGLYYTGKQYSHGPAPLSGSPYQAKRFESKQQADAELSSLVVVDGGNWDDLVAVEYCFLEVSISDGSSN